MDNNIMETPTKKIGFKGFNSNLECRSTKFEIGVVYSKLEKEKPRLCTDDGFHYCNEIESVFTYFGRNSDNRFCEIEVLGNFTETKDKSITTSFRIIREITGEIREARLDESMNLESIRLLQTKYPLIHVGGSIGLFLHGVRLDRWSDDGATDIDIVSPYFILFEGDDNNEIQYINGKKSSNDFDDNFIFNGIKVDCRVDPKQRYEIKEYKGFKYKVSTFETIMAAKVKYAGFGQQKHKDDIREMCGVK